jgi:hypothetical protein
MWRVKTFLFSPDDVTMLPLSLIDDDVVHDPAQSRWAGERGADRRERALDQSHQSRQQLLRRHHIGLRLLVAALTYRHTECKTVNAMKYRNINRFMLLQRRVGRRVHVDALHIERQRGGVGMRQRIVHQRHAQLTLHAARSPRRRQRCLRLLRLLRQNRRRCRRRRRRRRR